MRPKFAAFIDTYGVAMTPESVKSPDPETSAKSEGTQPKDSPQEDPDNDRGEAFERMFPDVPRTTPDRSKKPSQ